MPPQYTSDCMNHVIAEVSDNNGKIFVGTIGKDIIGLVTGCIERKDAVDLMTTRCPIRGIIMELVVGSTYRNKGVGELLLKTMEEYFLKSGCKFISIDVFSSNITALRFYENRGYVHSAEAIGRWCGAQRPLGGLSVSSIQRFTSRPMHRSAPPT